MNAHPWGTPPVCRDVTEDERSSAHRRCAPRWAFALVLLLPQFALAGEDAGITIPPSTVGLPVEVEGVVLPGSELEPVPLDDDSVVVIRIDAVYPHGTNHRYDLVVSALEPGTFDLADHLQRKDGTEVGPLPAMSFEVASLLPPGQVEPNRPETGRLPWYWDYRLLICILVGLWAGGLVALWRLGRPSRIVETDHATAAPTSLADRLRPLVGEAMAGRADSRRLAELERSLIALWRRRAGLDDVPAREMMSRLKSHPEAGPLLLRLEEWLHHPPAENAVDPANRTDEINALLAPYANLAPDALENVSKESTPPAVEVSPEQEPTLSGGPAR